MNIGDRVQIQQGATLWMMEHGYWNNEWPCVDGLHGVIAEDHTDLFGNDKHYSIKLDINILLFDVDIHPNWVAKS